MKRHAILLLVAIGIALPFAHAGLITQSGPRLFVEDGGSDSTPDAFSFIDQTDVALSSTITSAAVTITGIDTSITCSATGGTIDVDSDGDFQSSRNVSADDQIRARHTSSASNSTDTHTLVDCNGVSSTFTSTTEAAGGDADADFAARCNAAGVVVCHPMDDPSEFVAIPLQTAGDGTTQGAIDSTDYVSGGGSLKFNLRSGVSVPNIGGAWSVPLGDSFGENETFYVQVRFKVDENMLENNADFWRSSFKLTNIHGASSTCQDTEITTTIMRRWVGQILETYHDCGIGFKTSLNSTQMITTCSPTCLHEQASQFTDGPNVGFHCVFNQSGPGDGNGDGCFIPQAGTWYTLYQEIQLGTRGNANTDFNAWVAEPGGPYLQFHRVTGITWGSGDDSTFSMIRLETYMTQIQGAAPVTGHVSYDELIISSQPIALPEF